MTDSGVVPDAAGMSPLHDKSDIGLIPKIDTLMARL